jgi:adenine-specific DNA-methyltransferase
VSGFKTKDNNWIRNHDTILFYSKKASELSFIKKSIPASQFKKIAQSDIERYPIEDVWNGNEYDDLNSIAIVSFAGETVSKLLNKEDEVKGQKPEKLIQRIVNAHIDKGDIVLDFFGGSGTTAAAAHKMGVQYILCEQLNKHIDITLRRLQCVINGEQSGISKSVGWNPQNPTLEDSACGRYKRNNFIYLELKKFNQTFIERIEAAEDAETLLQIWEQMKEKSFLSYNVDIKAQEEHMEEFKQLDLAQQKEVLCELLDKNQLYVNLSDMNDKRFDTTDEEQEVTKAFYSKK